MRLTTKIALILIFTMFTTLPGNAQKAPVPERGVPLESLAAEQENITKPALEPLDLNESAAEAKPALEPFSVPESSAEAEPPIQLDMNEMNAVVEPAIGLEPKMNAESKPAIDIEAAGKEDKKANLYANYNARKYVLGPNDVINVNVLGVEELSKEKIKIQPDGKINLSGIGPVYATGLTFEELSDLVEEKYAFYVKNPQVVINLERSRPFIVQVTGAVSIPGSYEINTDTEISNALFNNNAAFIERKTPILSNILTAAGGINYDADVEHVKITNAFDGSIFEVNLLELLEKGKAENDIYLMAGDSVHVPKLPTPLAVDSEKYANFSSASFAFRNVPVRVIGYVNNPGLITLDPSISSGLNTAISEAGGYLGDAPYPPKEIFISRYSNGGKLVTTKVNPMKEDVTLMPNDVVYVPEKARPIIGRAFDFINRLASPAGGIASGYNHWSLMFDPGRFND